jgi:hypothetical protein
MYRDLYIELFVDINVNIQTFCLDDDQKEELKKHLEKYWHEHCKEMMLTEAHEKVFQMRIKELVDE